MALPISLLAFLMLFRTAYGGFHVTSKEPKYHIERPPLQPLSSFLRPHPPSSYSSHRSKSTSDASLSRASSSRDVAPKKKSGHSSFSSFTPLLNSYYLKKSPLKRSPIPSPKPPPSKLRPPPRASRKSPPKSKPRSHPPPRASRKSPPKSKPRSYPPPYTRIFTGSPGSCIDMSLTPVNYQGICYSGGPMILTPLRVYIIWYGNWSHSLDGGQQSIRNFFSSFNDRNIPRPQDPLIRLSDWWKTVQMYPNAYDRVPSTNVTLVREYKDLNYSLKDEFYDDYYDVQKIVANAINDTKGLPYDPQGLYLVLTSHDVKIHNKRSLYGGFCGQGTNAYCSAHNQGFVYNDINPSVQLPITFSWIGNAVTQCPDNCIARVYPDSTTPTGNPGVDGIINMIAHELIESVTNSDDSTGWYITYGGIADRCLLDAGTPKLGYRNGVVYGYNVVGSNGSRFYLQKLWDAINEMCAMEVDVPTKFIRR